MMKTITEEDGIHKEWYEEAKTMTLGTLPEFIRKLTEDYDHDYGTICHAISAIAVASANAVDRSDQGGITGFQAGFIMWGFIRHWMKWDDDERHQLVDLSRLLYPQYGQEFNSISDDTWDWLQKQATTKLSDIENVHPEVKAHWQGIVDGVVPFGLAVAK